MAREKELDGVGMHHMLSQSFNGTPKIVWDDNTKKIIKMAEKWQREIEKIEKHWKEVEPMMREMAQRVNEMYEEYKEYQRRNKMTQEQLERANFLKDKIDEITDLLNVHKRNVRMTIGSYPNNNKDRSTNIEIERKHQQEILALLTKWRDEYQKELEEL